MINIRLNIAILFVFCPALVLFTSSAQAQSSGKFSAKNWQLTDIATDSVDGTSVTKAYAELLKGKKSEPVIVAVIDAGLDTAHEDLQGHVWTNKKEISGNNIDDDHNGYVDDVHGWNFIGGKNGQNITTESLEADREYYRLHALYANVNDSATVTPANRNDYRFWLQLNNARATDSIKRTTSLRNFITLAAKGDSAITIWRAILKKDTLTLADINSTAAPDANADSLRSAVTNFYNRNKIPATQPVAAMMQIVRLTIRRQQTALDNLKQEGDPNEARRKIVGDDFNNINDRNYGNNNINAGTPTHGTHVAGIIAATRNNNTGLDGIADNVLIMAVRAAPDGDERDKDVALAIRYAVDNGARIINMSFGKPYSPGKKWVDEAVKYAETKDVLLVHAAGNDGNDIDTVKSYPSPNILATNTKAANFITVGASTGGPDSLLAAPFSNYGHTEVDLFAPGVTIYSTIPGNKYAAFSGTSMASPVVAGVAALLLEYYPLLSAKQLKYVLLNSSTKFAGYIVSEPGTRAKTDFSTLSVSGGVVNAYNALKLAATLKGEHKNK